MKPNTKCEVREI